MKSIFRVAGYAYAGAHRPRASYRWSVETTIYLDEQFKGQGLGKTLYRVLLKTLEAQGFQNAFAAITVPNEPSFGLHDSLGFELIGMFQNVGYKFEQWHSVGWWQLSLLPPARSVFRANPIFSVSPNQKV